MCSYFVLDRDSPICHNVAYVFDAALGCQRRKQSSPFFILNTVFHRGHFQPFRMAICFKIEAIIMAYTNTDFAAFQQMRRINPSKYHNQKTRKTMNATNRDVGMAEFFGIDTDDLTPVTEAKGTIDLPELILMASDRLEAGDLLFNELTDTTLGCLYATGGLPIHRAAANGEAHKIFAAMICTMWSDNIQLAVDHNASTDSINTAYFS